MSDHRLTGTLRLTFRVPEADDKAALFLRHLLKRLWRDRGWRCTRGELLGAAQDSPGVGRPDVTRSKE
jgi:hypothetical protein